MDIIMGMKELVLFDRNKQYRLYMDKILLGNSH